MCRGHRGPQLPLVHAWALTINRQGQTLDRILLDLRRAFLARAGVRCHLACASLPIMVCLSTTDAASAADRYAVLGSVVYAELLHPPCDVAPAAPPQTSTNPNRRRPGELIDRTADRRPDASKQVALRKRNEAYACHCSLPMKHDTCTIDTLSMNMSGPFHKIGSAPPMNECVNEYAPVCVV